MNYKTGHSFSSKLLFKNFYSDSLDNDINKSGGLSATYANKVFLKAFTTIIDDVINNNKVFKLPTKKEAYIEVQKVGRDSFKLARQQCFFKDIDITMYN